MNVSRGHEYGFFGELLRATGPACGMNPFRFSTKYQDDETDLVYYGYRYYSASTGRWISRDPIEEKGGNNLYRFVSGDSLNQIDADGRIEFSRPLDPKKGECGGAASFWSFRLSSPAPCDGYFVQKVVYQIRTRKCGQQGDYTSYFVRWWEVWPVLQKKGDIERHGGLPLIDSFVLQPRRSTGTQTMLGTMRFVCASDFGNNDPLTWPNGELGDGYVETGDLPNALNEPLWWKKGIEDAPHYLSTDWDCCCGRPESQLRVSP